MSGPSPAPVRSRVSMPATGVRGAGPRHVAVFLPSLEGGGAERAVLTIVNEIAHRGHKVDLVLASASGPLLGDVSSVVRVVDLKVRRVVKALLPLASYLRSSHPETMLSAMGHANVVALLARRISGARTRLVISERGTISKEYEVAQGVSTRAVFKLIPWLYPWADAVCSVSKAASEDLARFVGPSMANRVTTIYNPFDLERIARQAAESIDHPWFTTDQPPLILAIGRLNEAKDFAVLIRAFARLRATRAARLLILGEGELRSELQAEISRCGLDAEAVQMPGFVANPYAYLARCHLFVLSSRREALPGALIEALICGAPMVSTNCTSGPEEILEGGRWGRLVPVGDERALSRAMGDVLDNPRAQLPDTRRRALDFDKVRAVDAYLDLLGV